MDTYSFYMAITVETLEDLIKPELKEEFEKEKNKCISSDSNEKIKITYQKKEYEMTKSQYEKRTPLLFKKEFSGDFMIAICPKMYDIEKKHLKCLECDEIAKYGK